MTLEARTAAAHAVLNSAATQPDLFWEAIPLGEHEPLPTAVTTWLYATLDGTDFYPRGILAQFALGRTVQALHINDPENPEEAIAS